MQMVPPGEYFTTGESRQSSASGNNLFEFFPSFYISIFISCLRINLFMSFHETFRGSNFYPDDFLFFGSAILGCVHILGLTVLRKDEVQTKSCLGKGGDLFRWPQLLIEFVMKDENKIVHNSNSEHFSLLPQLSIARMDPLSQVCPSFGLILHQS